MRRREFLRTFTVGAAMPMMARAAIAWQSEASARYRDYRWVETNSPGASSRTDDIWFINSKTGWLVNSNGQVMRTDNGGDSWEQQLSVPPNADFRPYLRCIGFADAEVGWFGALVQDVAAGSGSYVKALLHHTRNGGRHWEPVENLPEGSPQGVCGLSVVSKSVVYASGENDPANIGPRIVKTTDGGKSWSLIDMSPHASNLIDIHFVDEDRGWVVGGKVDERCSTTIPPAYAGFPQYARLKPVVLYTADGGRHWEDRASGVEFPDCGEWGWKIFFLDDRIGFISLENFVTGAILKTTDGGKTWRRLPIDDRRTAGGKEVRNANLEGIGFLTEDFGWVGGWGDAEFIGNYNSVTRDGGLHWHAEDHIPGDPSGDVRINVNRYRFVGDGATAGYCSGKKVYKYVRGPVAVAEAPSARPSPIRPTYRTDADGRGVAVRFTVPEGVDRLYVGLWNHFGWHVRDLINDRDPAAGEKTVTWDGKDDKGRPLAGGVYICRLAAGGQAASVNIKLPSGRR
jgi:photosystem II stability/assembly factor-like uncharacterized protein